MRRPLTVRWRLFRQRWRDELVWLEFTGDDRPSAWWHAFRKALRGEP